MYLTILKQSFSKQLPFRCNNLSIMKMKASSFAATLVTFWFLELSEAFNCKFPNEGCEDNSECCSGKCIDAHPGTNARCTKLSLHKPCLYTYQCEDRLRCGRNSKCCAKYWGICNHARDCCDPDHQCFEVEGFYYKRCLYSNNINQQEVTCRSSILITCTLSVASLAVTVLR